jgi:hypothetical protein
VIGRGDKSMREHYLVIIKKQRGLGDEKKYKK